mgnify:CR=1 FL=1
MKVAIITGAAMGQGAAEAYLFAKEGAKVVATDMCEDILRETVQKINEDFSHSTIALKLNVTDEEEWKKVVEECINQFGTVDILLNNAGIGSKGINYDKTDYQAFENVMKINAWGPFVGMKTVAPIMIKNKKGSIINVSSLAAVKSIEFNAYSLSKGAVISLTKAASADLGKNGIRVNTIIPGTIETPMTKIICDYPNVLNSCIEKTALGHIGEADDIAYCMSDIADGIDSRDICSLIIILFFIFLFQGIEQKLLYLFEDFRVVFHVFLDVFSSLSDPVAIKAVPGAGFVNDLSFYCTIDHITSFGNSFAVHDIEFRLFKRRGYLILDDFDLRSVP